MTRVCFVRHAVHGLVGHALAGRMPGVHLTEEGVAQAARLAKHFAEAAVTRIVSSPLERCIETAEPIATATGVMLEVDERLIELDCGAWTGKSFADLQHDARWHRWNSERDQVSMPDGESMSDVQQRIGTVLDQLAAADAGLVLLVTHSDVIKAAVARLLALPLNLHDRIEIDPASITTLDLWPDGGKLVRMNAEAAA